MEGNKLSLITLINNIQFIIENFILAQEIYLDDHIIGDSLMEKETILFKKTINLYKIFLELQFQLERKALMDCFYKYFKWDIIKEAD